MSYQPDKHHRRSIRLKNYDYSQAGAYFITICVQHRQNLLGEIQYCKMYPSEAGKMVQQTWDEMPKHYPGIELDAFVLMPNHLHGIILLSPDGDREKPMRLGDVVHRFKSFTTTQYRQGIQKFYGLPSSKKLWQRNYYEHIIRDQASLDLICHYIDHNPEFWQCDRLHPNQPKFQTDL